MGKAIGGRVCGERGQSSSCYVFSQEHPHERQDLAGLCACVPACVWHVCLHRCKLIVVCLLFASCTATLLPSS